MAPGKAVSPDKSLAEILAHRMRAGEPIPVPLTLAILRQVCDALDYAHNLRDPAGMPLGIIHRDVSPAHIYVGEGGRVTLVGSTSEHGTFAYMAPEYVMTGMLDWRADLFALGVVAHEMLANRPLFATGDDRETLDRVCALAIPPPSAFNPQVAPDIDGIVLIALARDPAYRWQHAAMMRDGLMAVAQRLGLDVAPTQHAAWVDVLAEPVASAPVLAPAPVLPPVRPSAPMRPPVSAPPPGDPDLWADDTNNATRIEPLDLAKFEAAMAPAPVAAVAIEAASVAPAPVAPAPADAAPVDAAPVARAPVARTRAPVTRAPAARAPVAPAPLAPAPLELIPLELAAAEPAPVEPVKPVHAFDPELGPEPTQIGAMPLIEFGDVPLVAKIGGQEKRAPARTLPPPSATFIPEPAEDPSPARNKRIAILVILVAVALVVILLAVR